MVALFLSTPCYGGVCLQEYAESIIKLQQACVKHGIQLMLDTTENESLVHRARSLAVARFMYKSQADYFLFIDADVQFEAEAVIRLIACEHDVSCAVYPKKVVMWDQAEYAVRTGDTRSLDKLSAALVMNFKHAKTQIVNGFAEVLDGPTGFLMIKRHVLDRKSTRLNSSHT